MFLTSVALALTFAFQAPPAAPASDDDLTNAFTELKAAEEKKDNGSVKKWATQCFTLSGAVMKAGSEDADGKSRSAFAKDVATYAEYALSAAALRTSDHKEVMDLREMLAQHSPDSKYLVGLNTPYLAALEGTGNQKKEFTFAEKAIGKDPNNEALLAILADGYYTRKNWAQAANYGAKLATAAKHEQLIGRGYYLAGQAYAAQNKHSQADKALRAALPHIKAEPGLYAPALFQLGVSDYNLAKLTHDRILMKDAINFSEECSKMSSPVAGQAAQNAFAMKKELATIR